MFGRTDKLHVLCGPDLNRTRLPGKDPLDKGVCMSRVLPGSSILIDPEWEFPAAKPRNDGLQFLSGGNGSRGQRLEECRR